MVVDFLQQACSFKIGNNLFTCLVAIHADIGFGNQLVFFFFVIANRRIDGEYIDQATVDHLTQFVLVAMALPNLVVIEIMRGCNFYATCTEFRIDMFVGNHGNASSG